ncbi:unnamed protein product [Arabis nemorensis]|uniref:CCHC-type domain-containing protein n=1 Tax=Arabis nemorensis TaxID=586526 RepID=A0A565BDH5_9BRAS|nr:unnamed protein product [Arabis nemorensis]
MFESTPVETFNAVLRGLELEARTKEASSSITSEGDSTKCRRKRGECFQCGGRGHISRDCFNQNRSIVKTRENKQSTPPVRQAKKENQSSSNELPEYQMLAFDVGPKTYDNNMWMIYSTTSNHMTPYERYFTTLDRSHKARIKFMFGDGVMSEGIGDVVIMTDKGKKKTIKNVLYVPKNDRNVLSVDQLTQSGYGIVMTANKCTIKDQNGRLFGETMWEDRGFFLRLKVRKPIVAAMAVANKQFGHFKIRTGIEEF